MCRLEILISRIHGVLIGQQADSRAGLQLGVFKAQPRISRSIARPSVVPVGIPTRGERNILQIAEMLNR